MNKHSIHYKTSGFIMSLFTSLLMLTQVNIGYAQSAYIRHKYTQNESFAGFQPSQELIEKRTQNAKHFDNGNGTFTAVTGNTYHYKDASGKWQDIDLTLQPASEQGFAFKNQANEFESYFPATAGNSALQMKLGQTAFNWWSQPTMSLSANGHLLQSFKPASKAPSLKSDGQTINYTGVYDGVTEQFVMKKNGIENNTIINHLSPEIMQSPSGTALSFSQFIPLQSGWTVDVNGEKKTGKFSAENFHISIPGTTDGIYFGSILIFDNSLNFSEAEMLYMSPIEKLSDKEKLQRAENTLLCKYDIQFTDGGMIVSVNMPTDWLKSNNRAFPVTIDPTVTITPTPVYSGGYFYAPTSNWYGYQRHADLYLASEIGVSNIVISAIEFNRVSTSGSAATSPYKVFMRTTTANSLISDQWNSATYTGGLTASFDASVNFHGTTTGWKMFTLANPYTYTGNNLIVMVSDFYGGSGSAKYLSLTNSSTPGSRQAYKRQDNTDPGDASTLALENYLPEIRLTYSFGVPCAGTPSAGTASASVTNACLNTPFNISLTGATSAGGITYQWQSSPAGLNTFTDISGATSMSYGIANQTAASDYRCIVTCTNVGGSADTSNTISVGQNTPSQCYCTPTGGSSSTTYYLNNITSSGGLSNFTYTASSYSAYSDGYASFSAIQLPGSNLNVTLGSSSTASNYYYCWVDWNSDGDFQDAGETIFATTSYAVAPYNGVIPVPGAQAPGSYRMRFALSELGAISSPCGPAAYGNFVDLQLIVGSPTACTGTPTDVNITPSGALNACSGSLVQLTSSLTPILTNDYTYQWYMDGNPIMGATNSTYTYTATASANLYLVVRCAGSPADSTISDTAAITVTGPCGNLCTPTGGSSSTTYYLNKITTANAVSNLLYTASSYTAYNDMYNTYSCTQFPGSDVNVKLESSSTASNYYYCWVDWNNDGDFSDPGETVFATTSYAVAPYIGVIHVPVGQLTGSYHVRLALSEAGAITACGPAPYGNYVDVKLIVINQSACSLPISVAGTSAPDSLMLTWDWTQNIHPLQSFNIQYGMTGYQLNSGNSIIVPANGINYADTVYNSTLMGSGVYQVYVQAVCATGDTSAYSGPFTVVMPITNDIVCSQEALQLGQTYTFNNTGASVSTNESNIAPPATGAQTTTGWVNSTLNGTLWYSFVAPASGSVRVNSTAIEYNGQAAVYSATDCADFNTFTLIAANDDAIGGTSLAPNFTICGLTPGTTYYVMYDKFNTNSGNFSLNVSAIVLEGGTANPVTNVCTGTVVDLFSTITGNSAGGTWSSSIPAVNASIIGSNFESNGLAYSTFNLQYRVVDGCAYDSIISQVKIYPPSNAGQDGVITACKNEPIDLLAGLNGNTDLNGDWYDPSNVLLPNSQVITGIFPGQYNYDYISGNGVCPDDTANVVVTVINCNWLSVDENALEEVSIYPNPSTGVLFIESGFTGNFNLVITDINGRTVQTGQNTISTGTNTVNLKEVERGTYFFKLSNENAEKVFRVVIQ
jgi:hypothetical protein